MVTYGTRTIPSDEITVEASTTVNIGLAFDRTLGFIGGMDEATGSATAGTVTEVSNPTDARNKFGDGSELHDAAIIAFQYNIDTLYAVGLSETTVTDEVQTTATGSLDNSPLYDPNLHGTHGITVTDPNAGSDLTVEVVYDSSPSQPSDADTIRINPLNGAYAADAAPDGTDYEFDYVYSSDYTTAITELLTEDPRVVALGTELESHVSQLATDLGNEANDFVFSHGVAPIKPAGDEETASSYASGYSDGLDDKRVSVVGSGRGYTDVDETEEERTCWGVAAALAEAPLGTNTTNNELFGYESLEDDFSTSDAGTLIDSQVMPLLDYPPVTIIKDMTTSTTTRFERVFQNQIVDEGTARAHTEARNFVGELNTDANQRQFARSLRNQYIDMRENAPRLLDNFAVSVSDDAAGNDDEVDVEIGLDIVDSIDIVDIEIGVGDVITNNT